MGLFRRPLVSVAADTDVMSYERRRSAIDDAALFVEPARQPRDESPWG
jgi:hypothetical protein